MQSDGEKFADMLSWTALTRLLGMKTTFLNKYSVMQSDGNSLKFYTFRKAITSELMV